MTILFTVGQLKIYPYGICTMNQENQNAILKFQLGQYKIYIFGISTMKKKSKCYSIVPFRVYIQLKYNAFKIGATISIKILRVNKTIYL